MKILVSDPLAEEGLKILEKEKDLEVDVKLKQPQEVLQKIIKDYEALIVRSQTKVTKEMIEAGIKLKVIGRAGVGLDNIDVETATLRGIVVMNAPEGNTISTAEHTMSLILALSRNVASADASLKEGEWNRKKFMGVELYGKVLGIVGLGRIGTEVAKRAQGFGMKIIAYDPYLSLEKAQQLGIEKVDFTRLLKNADYITFHVPLTNETRHMLGKKELDLVKPELRIINCARGGIIDEDALYEALKEGKVAGAALDVFEIEPPKENPLLKLGNVIVTPHLGASTEEAQVNVSIDIAEQVRDALLGRGIRNAVNVPCIEPQLLNILQPYINLAEKIGSLQAQISTGDIKEVTIKYSGEITTYQVSPITLGLIKGILTPILQETVNFVNAPLIAKERGIKVIETKTTEVKEFANLISVEVITNETQNLVMGTLFKKNDPRIVKINEFYVEAIPSGYMLLISNWDRPGVIGNIGTILGENKINIAGMTFGRMSPGGKAITVLNIDSLVSDEVIRKIKSTQNIVDARLIKL